MEDKIDKIISQAVAASSSPDEAAALIRESLAHAGYVITKRPEIDQAPASYMPVFRASER